MRLCVPVLPWVHTLSLTFATARASLYLVSSQLWLTVPKSIHEEVNQSIITDTLENPVDQSTHLEWSCDREWMMPNVTKEQKQVIKIL